MAVYLFTTFFYFLLLLLIISTLCVHVSANSNKLPSTSDKTVELFQKDENGKIKSPEGKEGAPNKIKAESYYSPLLLLTSDVLMAVAGVNYKEQTNNCNDILTKYIKVDGKTWENIVSGTGNQWTTQFALQNKIEHKGNNNNVIRGLLGVATDKNIYILLVNYTILEPTPDNHESQNSEIKFVVGTVKETSEEKIVWDNKLQSIIDTVKEFKAKLKGAKLINNFFSGSAFLTTEGIVVFALVMQSQDKTFVALIYLKKDEDTKLNLAYKEIDEKCCPFFFSVGKENYYGSNKM